MTPKMRTSMGPTITEADEVEPEPMYENSDLRMARYSFSGNDHTGKRITKVSFKDSIIRASFNSKSKMTLTT